MDLTLTAELIGAAGLVLLLAAAAARGGSIKRLERRLDRVEGKLDLLMRHLEVPQPGPNVTGGPTIAVDPDVVALARAGRKIEAIKRYREINGGGLKDAKDAVERLH